MNVKKTFSAFSVIFLLMSLSSAANAKITEQQALSDERIAPYVELTRQYGKDFLPGRYAHVKETLSRVNPQEKIYAATEIIVEIGQFNSENNAHSSIFDVYGKNLTQGFYTLDLSGEVPVMRAYAPNDKGEYKIFAEDYAVVMPEDSEKYAWLLASVETGEIRFLYPINDFWFPSKWYEGDWKSSDGYEVDLDDDGEIEIQEKKLGTYTVSDNRILIKTPDGKEDVIYCANNPYEKTLVMAFTDGSNSMSANAGVFVKDKDGNKKSNAPVFKAPETSKQEFPKFPGKVPEANIEGVWQTYMNGQQIVLQFQGNNYYIWLNGQPAEMGSFQRNGNILNGRKSTGETFTNTVQVNDNTLILSDVNNMHITYQKVK